jgi:hypothetical protein
MTPVRYRTADVDGFKIFYREAGPAAATKLSLLCREGTRSRFAPRILT